MSRLRDWLVAGAVLLAGRGPRGPERGGRRIVPALPPNPGAEAVALALLALGALCALAFPVIYGLGSLLPNETQLLGASLGLSLLFIAAALILAGSKLVVTEEIVEEYPQEEHPTEQEETAQLVEEGGDRLSRRRLFTFGLAGAGGALGLALLTPAVSFGPLFRVRDFLATPWRRGRRLVDENGKPLRAADIAEKDFYTAFPEGADRDQLAAPVVVVRLPPSSLHLPRELAGYDAGGIVAYSKICTHAGCAISLYRSPLFRPAAPGGPALVCPCHYSTFDPADGGSVIFGPAGRRLPMLPIYVDSRGELRAKHTFDDPVGPSWWGVRMFRPHNA